MRTKFFWAAIFLPWILASHGPSGGGTAAWTDTIDISLVNSSASMHTIGDQWTDIVIPAGTASKLHVDVAGFSFGTNIKIGLYDPSSNLLASGVSSVSGTGVAEVNISPTVVAGGTYKIAWCCQDNSDLAYGVEAGVGQVHFTFSSVSLFNLFSTLPSPDGNDTRTIFAGVFITP